jgi:hypothetical protein
MLIDFYNRWIDGDRDFQLLSIYYQELFKNYKELTVVILNFQITFTFKSKE